MYRVGMTGGIGSGKSTAAGFFSDLGIEVLYSDQLARQVVSPGQPALASIAEKFGDLVLATDGSLDRAALRGIIFNDEEARKWLETLLHPIIRQLQEELIAHATSPYVVLEIPLLTENQEQLRETIDRVLVIDALEKHQLERTGKRDHINDGQVEAIMASQSSREERLKLADDIILNSGTVSELKEKVNALHQKYLGMASDTPKPLA